MSKMYSIQKEIEQSIEVVKSRANRISVLSNLQQYNFELVEHISNMNDFIIDLRKNGKHLTSYQDPCDNLLSTRVSIYNYNSSIFYVEAYNSGFRSYTNVYIGKKKLTKN